MTPVINADGLQRDACNGGQKVREQVRATVDRQDEPLATFRCHGLPVTEETIGPSSMEKIAAIANVARIRIRKGAGRRDIDDLLLQISVLSGGV